MAVICHDEILISKACAVVNLPTQRPGAMLIFADIWVIRKI